MVYNLSVLETPTNFDVNDSFNYAFNFCGHKLQKNRSKTIRLLKRGDRLAHSNFRYGLAKKIGVYLGNLSKNLLEVYVHGSSVKNKSGPGSDLDIIILLENKLEPFNFLLFKLNDEVEFFYKELMEKDYFTGCCSSFLDIKLVNRSEFESRKGFGAVINSINYAPIRIWQGRGNERKAVPGT